MDYILAIMFAFLLTVSVIIQAVGFRMSQDIIRMREEIARISRENEDLQVAIVTDESLRIAGEEALKLGYHERRPGEVIILGVGHL